MTIMGSSFAPISIFTEQDHGHMLPCCCSLLAQGAAGRKHHPDKGQPRLCFLPHKHGHKQWRTLINRGFVSPSTTTSSGSTTTTAVPSQGRLGRPQKQCLRRLMHWQALSSSQRVVGNPLTMEATSPVTSSNLTMQGGFFGIEERALKCTLCHPTPHTHIHLTHQNRKGLALPAQAAAPQHGNPEH